MPRLGKQAAGHEAHAAANGDVNRLLSKCVFGRCYSGAVRKRAHLRAAGIFFVAITTLGTAVVSGMVGASGLERRDAPCGSHSTRWSLQSRVHAEDAFAGCRLSRRGETGATAHVGEPIDFVLSCAEPVHFVAWHAHQGIEALVALLPLGPATHSAEVPQPTRMHDAAPEAPGASEGNHHVLRVTPLDVGALAFSALRLTTSSGTTLPLREAPAVEVVNPLVGTKPLVARDGTRPWLIAKRPAMGALWLIGAVALLGLAVAMLTRARRQRRGRKARSTHRHDPVDALLAAVRKWEAILALERGDSRDALAEVDQALREVIHTRAAIPARTLTTNALADRFRSPSSDVIRMLSVTAREHWATWFENTEGLRFRPGPLAQSHALEQIKRARDLTAALAGLPASSASATTPSVATAERLARE